MRPAKFMMAIGVLALVGCQTTEPQPPQSEAERIPPNAMVLFRKECEEIDWSKGSETVKFGNVEVPTKEFTRPFCNCASRQVEDQVTARDALDFFLTIYRDDPSDEELVAMIRSAPLTIQTVETCLQETKERMIGDGSN